MVQMVKNLPAMKETRVQSLNHEDTLEKGMATPLSFLPGGSAGQRSLAGYSVYGVAESDTAEVSNTFTFIWAFILGMGLTQGLPCFLGFHIGLELHCWLSWPLACRLQFVGPLSLHNHMS